MKILFFGDIVGKIGRRAVATVLPQLIAEHTLDLVVANVENLAHGTGVTEKTLAEMTAAGVQAFTSGNHILKKPEAKDLLERNDITLIRPANYPATTPGRGYAEVTVGGKKILLINLIGQVFFDQPNSNPFTAADEILHSTSKETYDAVLVDFHAEATSEKVAMGWYLDGRVSAVVGTHTHVPTADERVLPSGTAYISDVGMCAARDSVIGVAIQPVLDGFLIDTPSPFTIPETGPAGVNAVLIEVGNNRRATTITRLDRVVEV